MNFAIKENETFFQCLERFKELLLACTHHEYETWQVISFFFYDSLCSSMRQFQEMMRNVEFMSKAPDETWDYFDLLLENAQVWDITERTDKTKPGPISKGGLYHVKEDDDVSACLAKLTRMVKAIELSKLSVEKMSTPIKSNYRICETNTHLTKDCPTIPAFQEVLHEQANMANAYQRPFNSPFSKTYNPNWRNYPNFSWRNGPYANEPQRSSSNFPYVPPHKKTFEDTMQTFV